MYFKLDVKAFDCKSILRGYKTCLEELQRDSNENFGGRIEFRIPAMITAFVGKKSDRTIDGSTYKTYLSSRPQSMTEANDTRTKVTNRRFIVESVFKDWKRFLILRNKWEHSKIQSQVSFKHFQKQIQFK